MKNPVVTVETITPTIAAQMLGTSLGNRNIRKSAVNRYAREMIGGKWVLNGESIKFDVSGHLVDGHHRLNAILASQMSIAILVIRNVPLGANLTLDTGVGRSFHDAAVVAGQEWHRGVGPIARWWYRYDRRRMAAGAAATHQELTTIVEAHPAILESAGFVGKLKTVTRSCVPAVQGFVHAYTTEKYDREMADVFLRDLNDGADLGVHNPVFLLRRILVEDASRRSIEPYRVMAFTIKAWNAWFAGDKMKQITWRNTGASPEDFPLFTVDQANSKSLRRSRSVAKRRIVAEERASA